MIYKLVLGDWSDDGHGKYKEFLYDCNYDVSKIRQAYKDSCKKLGLAFNHNEDYTGLGLNYGDKRLIFTEYEDNSMSPLAFNILREAGCLDCFFDKEELKNIKFDNDDFDEELDDYLYFDVDEVATLIMNFISLSMPEDFVFNRIDLDFEPINGYWNKELNVQFGYGLFE